MELSVRTGRWVLLAMVACWQSSAAAQAISVEGAPDGGFGSWGLLLSVNYDDDDENRRMDDRQSPPPAGFDDDRRLLTVTPPAGAATVAVEADGAERIRVHAGHAAGGLTLPASIDAAAPVNLLVDGVRASAAAGDVALRARFLDAAGVEIGRAELRITVVGVALLDARNAIIDPTRGSLQVSNEITTNDSLPRDNEYDGTSPDPDNFRVEVFAPGLEGASVSLESRRIGSASPRATLADLAVAGPAGAAARSRFIRLVADTMDWTAPGVALQVLRADLRDRVSAVVTAADGQRVSADLRVGRPGNEDGPQAARLARWNIHLLRLTPGGPIALGVDEDVARKIARDQVAASNEVYAACNITFGPPGDTPIAVEDPPGPTLLAIADVDGLWSGGGEVRFEVNGIPVGPVAMGRNWPPHQAAAAIGQAIEKAGFAVEVSENAPVDYGAGPSADVLVRDRAGAPVRIAPVEGLPLTTDRRQSLAIGSVDLGDRLSEFNNATSSAGTLEERTMVKALEDSDPATIDLFAVNRFAGGGRQGEAFIEHDAGRVINALVLDRTGIRQSRQAWTQAHEAGHVLLNDPYHPDNFGEDRPWLLMDADASLGAVTGPKRLTHEDCDRITRESGVDASPPLLERYDAVPPERLEEPEDVPVDLGYPGRSTAYGR